MGVEVRQTLEREYDIVMAMREIRQLTIKKLKELSSQSGVEQGGESVWKGDIVLGVPGTIKGPMPR